MVRNIQGLLRLASSALSKNISQNISISVRRTLYSASALGIDGYSRTRDNVQQQFLNMSDKFREKMHAYVNEESKNMIFTEDLKNMLHLVADNPQDLDLLHKMMIKFNKQNKEMRFGSFIFGPVVMRAYYFLEKADEALAAFYNPELDGFFDQVISYQILMDLLYNQKRWTDLRKVYQTITTRITDFTKHPRHAITLVLGGCYKENTVESMKFATDLWQELKERGHSPMRRSATFFAGLALQQGRPDITVEVMFNVKQASYVTVRNLKVAGLADLDRLDDVVPILRMSLMNDNPTNVKHTYTYEVFDKLNEAIQRVGLEGNEPIVNMVRQLKQNGHIVDTSLDDLISSEIAAVPRTPMQKQNSNYNNFEYNSSYQQSRPRRQFVQYQRPGLKELI